MLKLKKEIWRPVPYYAGLYEVSSLGIVRSCDYYLIKETVQGIRINKELRKGVLLKPYLSTSTGYLQVSLHFGVNKGGTTLMIHRLVARAFLGEPPEGKGTVDHLDSDRTNNKLSNLRWASHSDQRYTAIATGNAAVGDKHYKAVLSNEEIVSIKERYIPKHRIHGGAAIAKEYRVCRSTITKICAGINRKHL